MPVIIKHTRTTPEGEVTMYFKKFGKTAVDWVSDPKDAKKYKDDFATSKDLKILRQVSKGSYFTVTV